MKKAMITTSLLAVLLLLLTPSIPAIQCTTVIKTEKEQLLQQIQSMDINDLKEKIKTIDFTTLKQVVKIITTKEVMTQLAEFFKKELPSPKELLLFILVLCTVITSIVTFQIGAIIDCVITWVLCLITLGKWEYAIDFFCIPGVILFWIAADIYYKGVKLYDWPWPNIPNPR